MRMIWIVPIICSTVLKAHETEVLDITIIEAAYALDQDTYVELHPKQKTEYAQTLANALHHGVITPETVMTRANKRLCHDISRSHYLSHGNAIDLNTGDISFSLRTLIAHNRLGRTVNEQGELDLSGLQIADFDGIEEIPNIHNVQTLNLSHNNISLLHPANFKALTSLKHLDLSFNQISIIRQKIFAHLHHLRTLNLSHNHMTHLDRNGFIGLSSLQKLSVAHNKLEWIGEDAFKDLIHLKSCDLSHNKLQLIGPGIVKPLMYLTSLNLSHNCFNIIHAHTLSPLRHLQQLDMSNNRITRVTQDGLYGLKNLQTLNLRNNRLTTIELGVPHMFPHLNTIIIGKNPLTTERLSALQQQLPNARIINNNPKALIRDTMPTKAQGLSQHSPHTTPKPLDAAPA